MYNKAIGEFFFFFIVRMIGQDSTPFEVYGNKLQFAPCRKIESNRVMNVVACQSFVRVDKKN